MQGLVLILQILEFGWRPKRSTYNSLLREARTNITRSIFGVKVCHWQSPLGRIRLSFCDISRDVSSSEEVDFDIGGGPVHGVHSSFVGVEGITKAANGSRDTATGGGERAIVVIVVGGADLGVGGCLEGAIVSGLSVEGC